MADALASGASVRKDVGVQVPPRAPNLSDLLVTLNRHWEVHNAASLCFLLELKSEGIPCESCIQHDNLKMGATLVVPY